jgi:GntR family transcriptional regulator
MPAPLLTSAPIPQHPLTMMIDKQISGDGQPRAAGPRIEFRLEPGSGVPTYLQLVHQVEHALRLGYLEVGDQLPKVKDVVAGLAINPNTVLKAYRDLEHKGLAVGRPGQGTFVAGTLGDPASGDHGELRERLTAWMADALAAGLDADAMAALFTSALHAFRGERMTGGTHG